MKIMRKNGVDVSERTAEISAMWVCDQLFFMETMIERASAITPTGVRGAVEGLGQSYQSSLVFRTVFGRRKSDGVGAVRSVAWNPRCECFAYTARQRNIP